MDITGDATEREKGALPGKGTPIDRLEANNSLCPCRRGAMLCMPILPISE
jgi:hypothetical protein